ncbi:MAG: hypothetical protein ABR543_03770 [Gemmatimonadaceae bacterium]
MLGLPTLDVVIGLVFIYIMLSLVVTTINEFIAQVVNLRGQTLLTGIRALIEGVSVLPGSAKTVTIPDEATGNQAIAEAKQTQATAEVRAAEANLQVTTELAKQVPTEAAAQAAVNAATELSRAKLKAEQAAEAVQAAQRAATRSASKAGQPAGTVRTDVNVERFYAHPFVKGLRAESRLLSKHRLLPSYVPPRTFVVTLLDLITPAHTGPNSVEAIRAQVLSLPEPLRQPLLVLIDDAEGNLSKFQLGVERWFNDAMERVSGFYKRRVQWITFGVAAAVTIVANADSSRIWRALSTTPALRAALVAQATTLVQLSDTATARNNTTGATEAIVDSTKTDSTKRDTTRSTTEPKPLSTDSIARAYARIDSLAKLGVPLGWPLLADSIKKAWTDTLWELWEEKIRGDKADKSAPLLAADSARVSREVMRHIRSWTFRQQVKDGLFRWPGLLLTAIAISLGAPFWFDVLNKFVNIRAAGRAPEEKPKSPEVKPPARGA